MISAQTYMLFVAPFVMGLGGLVIYAITAHLTRPRHHTPAE
ncbi:hypothetical protein [Methylobacterium sp. sgz302541]